MDNKFIKEEIDKTSFDKKIDAFLRTGISSKLPVAIWRIGQSNTVNAIIQLSNTKNTIDDIESCSAGFVVAPFQKEGHKIFIKADVMISSSDNEIQPSNTFSDSKKFDNFKSNYDINANLPEFNYTEGFENRNAVQKAQKDYYELINKTVEVINSGSFQKIVPSRTKKLTLGANFNPIQEFNKLCKAYPNAFVSLVHLPDDGLWLGATPELLISIDKEKIFRTVALAGTQAVPTDFQLSKAAWMQKDIEEQALVSRYIINCFKKIRLREFEEYGPKTARAGNLIHLKTEFEVNIEKVNFPQLGSVMLDLLHPTSAVCGMPMLPAAKFLKENEGYDREYYSGYLGPVNISDETHIFVNLRCMKIMKDYAILFAGGGITEDSEPESEWMETEIKFQTLLNVIQS